MPHGGPNVSRIPAAGIAGLVFALGTVWMFWFGVPAYRPIVVGAALVGAVVAVLLIRWRNRHPRRVDTRILDLRERNAASEIGESAPRAGEPANNEIQQTNGRSQ